MQISNFVAYIGVFGPLVLSIVIIFNLVIIGTRWQQTLLLSIWQPLSIIINSLLKKIINQDRPSNSKHINSFERTIDTGSKGMPSGHAQMVGSEVVFSYLAGANTLVQIIAIIQMLITLWQRYTYRKHTIAQLLVGLIVGGIYSYIYWMIYAKFSREKKEEKNTSKSIH